MSTAIEPEVMPPTEMALTVPADMTSLVADASRFEIAAKEFTVDSEAAYQVADQVKEALKAEAKAIEDRRLEFTRPIDAIKKKWMDWFRPAIDGRREAVQIYEDKMRAFYLEQKEKRDAAQREAERLLAEDRANKEAEARRLEEKAATLKTPAAQQRTLAEAENLRTVAALTPTSVAPSALPQTAASNTSEPWEWDKIEDLTKFLGWLQEHPEWHCVLGPFKVREMNRMAKQFANVVPVPGVKFAQGLSFRSKSR